MFFGLLTIIKEGTNGGKSVSQTLTTTNLKYKECIIFSNVPNFISIVIEWCT